GGWSPRSLNRAGLAGGVSESWNAWWTSWSSSWRRSEMSRVLRTSPPTLGLSSRLVMVIWAVHRWPSRGRRGARGQPLAQGDPGLVVHELGEPPAEQMGLGVPEHPGHGLADVLDPGVGVDQDDDF